LRKESAEQRIGMKLAVGDRFERAGDDLDVVVEIVAVRLTGYFVALLGAELGKSPVFRADDRGINSRRAPRICTIL